MSEDHETQFKDDWFNYGIGCYLHQMDRSAILFLSKAIEQDNTDGMMYYVRGLAFLELGMKENAQADFQRAHELGVHITKVYLDACMSAA